MTSRSERTEAVRAALKANPASSRRLAQSAGVSDSTLIRIAKGEAEASERTARKVADALDCWILRCAVAAEAIRRVLRLEAPDA